MANANLERGIPGIVPSDGKNFAHIDSKELDKSKEKPRVPITVEIFGDSIDGTTLEIGSVRSEANQRKHRKFIKKKRQKGS